MIVIPMLIAVLTAVIVMRVSARRALAVASRSDLPRSDYGRDT